MALEADFQHHEELGTVDSPNLDHETLVYL